jgi:integrase
VYNDLMPTKKQHLDLENAVVWILDSKTPKRSREVPLTPIAVETFRDQLRLSPCGPQEMDTSLVPIGGFIHGSDLESAKQLESGRSAAW